ncbi:cell envelope-like function transcriptional attenuator common domain protein [Gardnerella vaginalis]|uniref:Cell envelope-like function transcriptional attenuator common domain protein n=2 Tax=Gardnerella vaginalis TaxID=2702 RepID=A0A133NYU5_GARVA|nr:cell envelope-like function transcriptional attenuator common domain protein [Gardnerella vaginalis]
MALNNVAEAAAQMPVKKSHRFLHVFLALLTILVITCMGLGVYSWHWVDSRMNRTSWLTNTPSTQGTAWLILGSDQREGEEAKEITGFRTDTILVLTKPSNGHSSLISIPRDSLISFNGEHMKINSVAQFAGNKALTSVVESITGHRIDHVAEIRFNGLTNVVNALDGIDLCYNRTVSDRFSGLHWTSGCHHVDGATALAFSRMRYADPQSDFGRAARQRMVIAAIMKKALARDTITNLGKIKKLAKAGLSSVLLDEKSNPGTLWEMAQAFREATGSQGVSGTIYWTNPDYQVPGVGSSVLLDDAKNLDLFNQLAAGTHKPGAVGTLAELQNTAF